MLAPALVYQTAAPAALRWDGIGAAGGEYGYPLDCPDCRGTLRQQRGSLTLAGALKNGTPLPGLFPALAPTGLAGPVQRVPAAHVSLVCR